MKFDISDWKKDQNINGIITKNAILSLQLNAEIKNPEGNIIDNLKGEFKHEIWISPVIPFSDICYNIFINADAPPLFIEPRNYEISNERPWMSISNEIYNGIRKELKEKGMPVKIISNYNYYTSGGESYQKASGELVLTDIQDTKPIDFDPFRYPVISSEIYNQIRSTYSYSTIKPGQEEKVGKIRISTDNAGKLEGPLYVNKDQYFALKGKAMSNSGDTMQFVALKVSPEFPEEGNQEIAKIPVSTIRDEMRKGPPEGFTRNFIIAAVLKNKEGMKWYVFPENGELIFDSVSEGNISGSFQLEMKSFIKNGTEMQDGKEFIEGTFK